jgi:hypothetical protein
MGTSANKSPQSLRSGGFWIVEIGYIRRSLNDLGFATKPDRSKERTVLQALACSSSSSSFAKTRSISTPISPS